MVKEGTHTATIRMTPELHERLKAHAERELSSINREVNLAIIERLDRAAAKGESA